LTIQCWMSSVFPFRRITPDEVIAERSRPSAREAAALAVSAYDRDGDGKVSKREMASLSKARGLKASQVAAAFASGDTNRDGCDGISSPPPR